MNTQDWRRLHELADQLEEAWSKADNVDLGSFLPPSGDPLRASVLQELVTTDLEIRWRRKQGRPLEFYVAMYPEMGPVASLPPKLIYEEYRVRCRHGDQPELTLYQTRFPDQFPHVQKLLQQDPIATLQTGVYTPAASPPQAASAKPMDKTQVLPIGGGYTLEKLIGRGGFGEVWKALAPGGFPAAVKIIARPADHEERIREQRSLNVIKQLNHHFLIKTIATFSEEDKLYIVMDLADSSLRERLKASKAQNLNGVPLEELLRYFREAAEALDYLHEQDVLHRDIKPDNILLVGNHVRLADFGLARHQEQILASASNAGTPAYMAPEVWRGKTSKFSDQYSLAYTYAELRLGHRAFASTDYAGVMFDHLDNIPNLEPLPENETKVLLKALAKKPDERYPTCLAFVEALEDCFGFVPRASRQVPSLANRALPAMPKPREIPATQVGTNETGRRPKDASLVSDVSTPLHSLLPVLKSELKSITDPLPAATRREPPSRKRRRSVLPFFVIGAIVIGLLGGLGALIVPGLLHKPEQKKPDPDSKEKPPVVITTPEVKPWLPEHFEAAVNAQMVKDDFRQRTYYDRIVSNKPGVPPVTFILIPQKTEGDLPSYYLTETKVTNALCAALAKQLDGVAEKWPDSGEAKWPTTADKADWPAFGMSLEEAERMAHLLDGQLPTTKQWDRAAGFPVTAGSSPYVGGPDAAVNSWDGPRTVMDHRDSSVFMIIDMGGNGTELTRDKTKDDQGADLVILRGQRLTAPKPLSFADLAEQQKMPQVQFSNAKSPFTGFRVVIEPR